MSDISCAECQELEVEFALNTLSGETRARVINHLNGCPRCRATVTALTDSSERLLELMPERPPPPGFDRRVVTVLRQRAVPTRTGQWTVLAAAALVVITLLGGGWLLGRQQPAPAGDDDTRPGTRTLLYSPLTGEHGQLGQIYLYPDDHAWMYLSTDTGPRPTLVRCAAIQTDERTLQLGTYPLVNGRGGWQLPASVPAGAVVVATVFDARGKPLATARFPPAQPD